MCEQKKKIELGGPPLRAKSQPQKLSFSNPLFMKNLFLIRRFQNHFFKVLGSSFTK